MPAKTEIDEKNFKPKVGIISSDPTKKDFNAGGLVYITTDPLHILTGPKP